MKPTLTVTYGLGYALEMPPYELNGKQVMLTDATGNAVNTQDYLDARKAAALKGQVYNPTLGFATVTQRTSGGLKYPYNPFYGGSQPARGGGVESAALTAASWARSSARARRWCAPDTAGSSDG